MSRYFFDDSKDHDYEDEFERPGPIYQPAISPGKVTLTSRIVRAAPPPTNNAPAKSSQPSATPVQRKAETKPPIALVIDSKMSAWDLAIRPDLYSPPEADTTPIQRKQQREPEQEETSRPQPSGSGTALPDDVRTQMEKAFGADFSAVRIHEGPQAAATGALAYTQGNDIHFQPGQYDPQSQRGRELLGHELTHVVQQSQGRVQSTTQARGVAINDDSSLEREADENGARAAKGETIVSGKQVKASVAQETDTMYEAGPGSSSCAKDAPVQRRAIKDEEKDSLDRLDQLASATEEEWDANENRVSIYEGMPADMRALKTDLQTKIANVPEKEIVYGGKKDRKSVV